MRSIVAILALLAPLAAAQAPAAPQSSAPQTMTPIAKPAGAAPAAPAAAGMPVAMTKPAPEAKTARHWKKADARVCLEFPNDMQIIKCSENYR
jgi:hypothetical protein